MLVCVLPLLQPLAARADSLKSRLNTAWEVLWDERGTPQRVFRWREGVLRYRLSGAGIGEHREQIAKALALAAQHTGLQIREATGRVDPADGPLLDVEMAGAGQLEMNVACATSVLKAQAWYYEHVRIQLRDSQAWRCIHHEVLHAMGLRGHPSGSTILNYLHGRRDTFTELDGELLSAWYAPSVKPGFTLLEAWRAMRDQLVLAEGPQYRAAAEATADEVTREVLASFEALARGEGEVPAIVKRAGRASGDHMEAAVRESAYVLGLAYQRGTLVAPDETVATRWLQRAAEAGHAPAQVMLGRALRDGKGVAQDRVAALGWLGRAARAGNEVAQRELAALDAALSPNERAAVRGRAPR